MRSIYFINDYSMAEAQRRWLAGDYPGHHLWGMNVLSDYGWDVEFSHSPQVTHWLQRHIPKLNDNNKFILGLMVNKPRQEHIYCGSIHVYKLLGLFKSFGFLSKKVVPLIHHPVAASAINRRALSAADAVFFLNQFSHDRTIAAIPELRSKSHVVGWCVDTNFYDSQVRSKPPRSEKLIVAAGKELRDYDSLVSGIKMIADQDLRVEIYCSSETAPSVTDSRVKVFVGGKHGSSISYVDLLERYNHAMAIAVPLQPVGRTVGLTSLFDAFAMRVPLLVTRHPSIDAPIAERQLGYFVEPRSAEAWADAIQSVLDNPIHATQSAERARYYAESELSPLAYAGKLSSLFDRYFASA